MADPEMKAIHDEWMAKKPEGASHDPDACPFCVESPTNGLEEGQRMTDEATLQSKDEEIARLSAQVADLLAQANESAVEARIAEAHASADAKVAELQASLDVQVLEAEKAKAEYAELVTMLESAEAERAEADARQSRWAGRLEQIKEHASLMPEAHIEKNQERWSAMADDEFASLLEDIKAVGATAPAAATPTTPATALVASAGRQAGSPTSLAAQVMGLRFQGVDVRKVS